MSTVIFINGKQNRLRAVDFGSISYTLLNGNFSKIYHEIGTVDFALGRVQILP